MSDSKNQLISIEIPYYTHWTWALLVLSFIILILSICIVIDKTEKETKAELLISHIILSSCMFIGTIPFIIKTFTLKISDDNVGFYVLYPIILILSILNLTYSGMMLYKLEKEEEEEEETKNYSGATLPVVCFLILVFYAVSSTFEYKKNKKAMKLVYQGGEATYNKVVSLGKAAADKLEQLMFY